MPNGNFHSIFIVYSVTWNRCCKQTFNNSSKMYATGYYSVSYKTLPTEDFLLPFIIQCIFMLATPDYNVRFHSSFWLDRKA